jgi:predicted component of type VI protein secretion system
VAVLHLLAQTLLFGAAVVLLDVGLLQLLRPAWRALTSRLGIAGKVPHSRCIAAAAGTPDEAAPLLQHVEEGRCSADGVKQDGQLAGGAAAGGGAVDADVAAERLAVEAGEGLDEALVGVQAQESLALLDMLARPCCGREHCLPT